MMSPDSIPFAAAVPVSALLWLYLRLLYKRERDAALDHDSDGAVDGVVAQSSEHRRANDPVQREERDSQDDQSDEKGNDIHARIVSCPHLSRLDRLDGITRCPRCEP